MRPRIAARLSLFIIPLLSMTSEVFAETYIAAQGGVTLPQPLSSRQLTPPGWPEGTRTSNIALKTSAVCPVWI